MLLLKYEKLKAHMSYSQTTREFWHILCNALAE